MADTIWTNGAATRDLNTAGNFTGTVPEGTGTVYFLSDYTAANTGPNASMQAHTAIDQDAIYIGEGFTEDIGASGNDFQISADKIWHRGAGKLWFKDGDGTTDWIIADSTGQRQDRRILSGR